MLQSQNKLVYVPMKQRIVLDGRALPGPYSARNYQEYYTP